MVALLSQVNKTRTNLWKMRTTKILNIYADGIEMDSLKTSDFYSYDEIVKITPIESSFKRFENKRRFNQNPIRENRRSLVMF